MIAALELAEDRAVFGVLRLDPFDRLVQMRIKVRAGCFNRFETELFQRFGHPVVDHLHAFGVFRAARVGFERPLKIIQDGQQLLHELHSGILYVFGSFAVGSFAEIIEFGLPAEQKVFQFIAFDPQSVPFDAQLIEIAALGPGGLPARIGFSDAFCPDIVFHVHFNFRLTKAGEGAGPVSGCQAIRGRPYGCYNSSVMAIPNVKRFRPFCPQCNESFTVMAVLPKDANVDSFLADAVARHDHKAFKDAKVAMNKVRVGQQKQKKAK